MRNLYLLLFSILSLGTLTAQNCIEVETILVNACDDAFSSPEGLNEMFRFRVGANPINIADIQIVNGWPSQGVNTLPFNGFVQNVSTEAKTLELNNTITNECGYLIEPPLGLIPAGRSVLAITSYEVSVALNSFANLTDTLYVIYHQHTGQGGGHFLNYNTGAPQEQTLRIQVNGVFPCYEEVTYLRGNLVDANGNNADQNGAFVDFTPDGQPSYGNTSCQAPFQPFSADWTNPGPFCQTNAPIDLNTLITGTAGGTWSGQGVSGSTFDPSQVSGAIDITYTVVPTNDCNTQTASVTQTINVSGAVDAAFTNPGVLCGSQGILTLTTLLTGTPGGQWSGIGVNGATLNLTGSNGTVNVTYTVGSGTCTDSETQSVTIINLSDPVVTGQTVFCNGETPTALTVVPDAGATVNWYPNAGLSLLLASGDTYTPTANQNQTYWVNQTAEGCTSDSIPVDIEFSVVQLPVGDTLVSYCEGEAVPVLSVSGSNIQWYTSAQLTTPVGSGTTLNPPAAEGTFWVTATEGSCVSEALIVDLVLNDLVSAEITSLNGTSLCSGEPITLESADATLNSWNNGETAQSISIDEAGTYTLTREGECNTATDQIVITGLPVFADFTTSADSGYTVFELQVTDISINAETCVWTLNDSVINLLSSGILTFADSGSYNLQVICTNSSGCADTASRVIKVLSDQLGLIVPNVFTPGNGDGFNNLFQVKHNAVKAFSARVYNRWGKLLFTWEDKNGGWDGTSNGEKQADGTYFYIINGTDVKDQPFEERGTVTLLGN